MLKIIPLPQTIKELPGKCRLDESVSIFINPCNIELSNIAGFLSEELSHALLNVADIKATDHSAPIYGQILLTTENAPARLGTEGYQLKVRKNYILIRANKAAGLFYGLQTFIQLLPVSLKSDSFRKRQKIHVQCCEIEDIPAFQWRGMHYDVARNFLGLEAVFQFIDLLAMYKLNTFHWHLTDDQGWRVEIKKYPRLQTIGAWRKRTKRRYFDDPVGSRKKHGGYFSHEDIRKVVEYAAKRHITVVPEIEMPGHAMAALAAYPELGCTGGPYEVAASWGILKDVFCAGNHKVFGFLKNVLDEVMELFPSKYIHIGGDECPKMRWQNCPKCQSMIRKKGLADENELQSHFIKTIASHLHAQERRIIGWEEIMHGGLSDGAIVMSWRGRSSGIKAARMGHKVIMTPYTHTYLDFRPVLSDPATCSGWGLEPRTIAQVYSFNPLEAVPKHYRKNILGGQGCLWSEYVNNIAELQFLLMPRLSALAERLWTQASKCKWVNFRSRIKSHFKKFDSMQLNYCNELYQFI